MHKVSKIYFGLYCIHTCFVWIHLKSNFRIDREIWLPCEGPSLGNFDQALVDALIDIMMNSFKHTLPLQ